MRQPDRDLTTVDASAGDDQNWAALPRFLVRGEV
jgi:hypothetical protein